MRILAYSACSLPGVVKEGVVKRDDVKRLRRTLVVNGCGGRPNNRIKVSTPCRLYYVREVQVLVRYCGNLSCRVTGSH